MQISMWPLCRYGKDGKILEGFKDNIELGFKPETYSIALEQ